MRPLVSSLVLVLSAAAAVFTAMMLFRTEAPAVDTTVVVPPPSPTYSAAEVAAAKQMACDAWTTASSAMAQASNAVPKGSQAGWDDPVKQQALSSEAHTTLVETAYLREQVSPAAPLDVAGPIHDYLIATFDQEDATMRRMGTQVDAAIDRGNVAVDQLNAACGLK